MNSEKKAIIIGAGPAGLTAAIELLKNTSIKPIIFEETNKIGGISRTENYRGNKIDIGGHRFFSKSNIVMNWWRDILPIQGCQSIDDIILNRKIQLDNNKIDPEKTNKVMLLRNRLSRIFFIQRFFDYPITLNLATLKNLGIFRVFKIGYSYAIIKIKPIKNEKTLEDFFINRFGKELYLTFFKDYTEKLWGVECHELSADWGAQRIKGLSIVKVLKHAFYSLVIKNKNSQKNLETSLIESFWYPKYGPGQLWEEVAEKIKEMGGEIIFNSKVKKIDIENGVVKSIKLENGENFYANYFLSTMPVKELISGMGEKVSFDVKKIADGLMYRDFITVGVLANKLKLKNETNIRTVNNIIPDTWIYIQERTVKLGRIQVFNNWSPYLVSDMNKIWIGLEYFCNEGDELWEMGENEFKKFAIKELEKINIIDDKEVLDTVLIKTKKAYPAYFGTFNEFQKIRNYVDKIENLFLIGRNGMHRYNNMDHSMLTAMEAVKNIKNNIKTKDNIWSVNIEKEYHEKK